MPRLALLLAAAALAAAVSACGGTVGSDRPERAVTLLLDTSPNAVHAGVYVAVARGFDDAEGVSIRVRRPSASTDALRLLTTGRADFAVLPIHDLALAREQGRDLVGVLALVQRPLAALLARPGIRRPRDLEGRRVGVTGLPADTAVLRSIVAGAGGDPDRVRSSTIGLEAVDALLSGRVAAATAFWHVEGVALRRRRPGFREFRLDDYGAPAYPELVVVATRDTVAQEFPVVRALAAALRRGYERTQQDPESAVTDMLDRGRGLRRDELAAQLDAVAPAFTAGVRRFGALDERRLRAWADWSVRFGILRRRPDVRAAFALSPARP